MKKKKVRPLNDIIDELYHAVAQYVEHKGGNVAVIGGIQFQWWPGDLPYNFAVCIRCTGRKPKAYL